MADDTAAARQQLDKGLLEIVGGGIVDHWTHEGLRLVMRSADDQPAGELVEGADQTVVECVLHDQPARGGAALAGAGERGLRDDGRGGGEVGGVPDDDRIVAAHLQREDFLGLAREGAVERQAGARRAGEQQAVDAGMVGERLALRRAADDEADACRGHAGFEVAGVEEGAGGGGLFRRLEDDRVARDQRRDDMAVGQMRGEVVGAEHRQHAVRLVADGGARAHRALEAALRGAFAIGGDRDIDLGDD